MKRMNYINDFLKEKFGERTLKIGIDGGFTCPNRDGTKGINGCIFCSERGSGEHLSSLSIQEQINQYLHSYKVKRANSFILYFQNFSNTYASTNELSQKYDLALNTANKIIANENLNKKIVGLAIATRPDCINEEICQLLHSYAQDYYVTVELGLQTSNDITRNMLHCSYSTQDFMNANILLKRHHIPVIAHIMVGLPNETHNDIIKTINFINQQCVNGIKIHSTYVVKNTPLEMLYQQKKYSPISLEEYLNETIYIITHLNPNIVIHRISGDAPKNLLVAPEWNSHKKLILNGVVRALEEKDLWQGKKYSL